MSNDLLRVQTYTVNDIVSYLPEHEHMLVEIERNMPEIIRGISLFGKSDTQFTRNMLTVSNTTPLRNVRQILAQIESCKEALRQAHFKNKKKEIEVKLKEKELSKEEDDLKKELIYIEIEEIRSDLESGKVYISGAVRELTNYIVQYNSITKSMGIENFNEIDFEKEEEKYHIQKAFEQALTAARCRGGLVDEGNMIYFTQIGINGGCAQRDIIQYLEKEARMIQSGESPTHKMFLDFLNDMSSKYLGCSTDYAKYKGLTGSITESAALSRGDTRLITG